MSEHIDVVVIGAGQAGLATSHELTEAGVEHLVLERGTIGETWRGRWDSFCLVTPNWATQLPGHSYDGADPDGFMAREEIVSYLERYAARFQAPVRERVEVTWLEPLPRGGFDLRTSGGRIRAGSVVIATGAYQRPHRPAGAASLPPDIHQIDVEGYRNPAALPSGRVLVVGSGQSGCQIAEELLEAGRDVFLACGRAPWLPRRFGRHDIFWWAIETGYIDAPPQSLPTPAARLAANLQATGHGGGHDLHYRTLRDAGVTLLGHFLGAEDGRAHFADDLKDSVAWGDERYRQFVGLIRDFVEERGLDMPDIPEPNEFDGRAPTELDLSDVGAVIFAGGYRTGYGKWMQLPEAFDDLGFPIHTDGRSVVPGLFFVGVHFLRKRKSSLLYGVGEDAAIVAGHIAAARKGAVRAVLEGSD